TFSPDWQRLVTSDGNGITIVSDIENEDSREDFKPTVIATMAGHTSSVLSVAVTPDRSTSIVATASADGTVVLSDLTSPSGSSGVPYPRQALTGLHRMALSADGRVVAAAGQGMTAVWAPADVAGPVTVLTEKTASIRAVAFSPDGRSLA